jgi:hypothetical protein
VRDRLFARIRDEGDVLVVWCSDVAEKEGLIASDPAAFFTTAHYDGSVVVLQRLRSLCLALPETTERLSHGEPTWFVGGKRTFVTYAERHHDDRLAFWCAAPVGAQQEVVAEDPQRFFVPPYVGGRGWVGVRLDAPEVDWTHVAELVGRLPRRRAPPAVSGLDAAR